jgi:F-type H+-transporting ATPase subunit epsilon
MAGLPTKIKLEVVSPIRLLLSVDVDYVTLPGSEGYLGVLPGHLPLLTMLGTGIVSYTQGAHKHPLSVSGGFVEVLPDRVILMADTVELPEEIDVKRAREARERAEKRLASRESIDIDRAMGALLRATTRLHLAEQHK